MKLFWGSMTRISDNKCLIKTEVNSRWSDVQRWRRADGGICLSKALFRSWDFLLCF